MEENTINYLEIAKIVASCKANRLKLVLELLAKGGVQLSDDAINEALSNSYQRTEIVTESNRESKLNRYENRWVETTDPIILTLRTAYLDGYRIADIASAAGITRTALYEYMIGRRQYSPIIQQKFVRAFNLLSIPYPSDP